MADLGDLYQEVILDHNRHPRNFRAVPDATRTAEGFNPLCGDRVQVSVRLEGDRIADVGFQGSGCAISKAAASLMTDAVKGRTLDEARELFDAFHRMVTGAAAPGPEPRLARLAVFAGVREFPARVKCATLAWHTLRAAMVDETPRPVSTE
jgi:nitrogen fixation NifU-like protein